MCVVRRKPLTLEQLTLEQDWVLHLTEYHYFPFFLQTDLKGIPFANMFKPRHPGQPLSTPPQAQGTKRLQTRCLGSGGGGAFTGTPLHLTAGSAWRPDEESASIKKKTFKKKEKEATGRLGGSSLKSLRNKLGLWREAPVGRLVTLACQYDQLGRPPLLDAADGEDWCWVLSP